jgi:hypothetical protein
LISQKQSTDVLVLRNGDRVEGKGTELSAQRVSIKGEKDKLSTYQRADIAAMAFNSELISRARPKGIYGYLILANGSRLVVSSARLHQGGRSLLAKMPFGGPFIVPLDQVVGLDPQQGCVIHLSDLKPSRYEHTPFFGVAWPYVTDGSVAENDLRLGGSTYDKGLGMHSRSRLTYDLSLGYHRFEALVGLDDQTGRRGRVRIGLLLDGKPIDLGWNKELTARDKPLWISVSVIGKKELTLVVDFGQFGDVQGHVNWADARLIK